MRKPTLILVGCSWFCGEWELDGEQIRLCHPGMNEYLSNDYRVVSLSRMGGSNWQSLYALENYLAANQSRQEDFIVVVGQTDPMRPKVGEFYHVDYHQMVGRAQSFVQLNLEFAEIFYIKLAALGRRFQIRPQLVGGLSDVDVGVANLYSESIDVLIPSWIQLMDPTHKLSVCPLIWGTWAWESMREYGRMDIVEEMMDLSDSSFLRAQTLMESNWFGPTFGDFHPNRQAHQLMAQEITKRLG